MTKLARTNDEAGTFTKGRNAGTFTCTECGTRRQLANREVQTEPNGNGLCTDCFDRAGDDNAVSDGHMTCAAFLARYGEHSEYCDCKSLLDLAHSMDDLDDAVKAAKVQAAGKCTTAGCDEPRFRRTALKCTAHEAEYKAAAKARKAAALQAELDAERDGDRMN